MRRVLLAAAMLGGMLAVFTPAATADHNAGGQIVKNCPVAVTCDGTNQSERINGTASYDNINANGGDDDVYGYDNGDTIYGSSGRDDIYGGPGREEIYGGPGADHLHGGISADQLYAGCSYSCNQVGESPDHLYGEDGNDLLGAQNNKADSLHCGLGEDTAYADGPASDPRDSVGASCEHVHYDAG